MGGQLVQELVAETLTARVTNLAEGDAGYRRKGTAAVQAWFAAAMGGITSNLVGVGVGNATMFAYAFQPGRGMSIDRLAMRVFGAVATARARFGIYNNDPVTYFPTSLIVETGDQDASGVGIINVAVPAFVLNPGALYWFTVLTGTAAPNLACLSGAAGPYCLPLGFDATLSTPQWGWQVAQAYGALPVIFPTGAITPNTALQPVLLAVRST